MSLCSLGTLRTMIVFVVRAHCCYSRGVFACVFCLWLVRYCCLVVGCVVRFVILVVAVIALVGVVAVVVVVGVVVGFVVASVFCSF